LSTSEAMPSRTDESGSRAVGESRSEPPSSRLLDPSTHGLGCVQVEAAGEHPQPSEQRLLLLGQQVVAPGDRVPQRAQALGQVGGAAGEQGQPVGQARQQRLGRQDLDPGGGQLDRQRQPVEPAADLRDRRRIVVGEAEGRVGGVRPLDEERHRGDGRQDGGRRHRRRIGHGQRRHRILPFGPDAEGRAARRQDRQPGATIEERRQLGSDRHHLLQVVQQEQQVAASQRRRQGAPQRHAGNLAHAEGLGDRRDNEVGVADRRQTDEGDTVRELGRQVGADLERQPRLADPAGTGQRQQPHTLAQSGGDLGDLPLAADERRRGRGQGRRRSVGRPERGPAARGCRPIVVRFALSDGLIHDVRHPRIRAAGASPLGRPVRWVHRCVAIPVGLG